MPLCVELDAGAAACHWGAPTPSPALRAGKCSPPDGLGGWPRKAATSPKPLSVLGFRLPSRVRSAGLRPPLTATETRRGQSLGLRHSQGHVRDVPSSSTRKGSTRKGIEPRGMHWDSSIAWCRFIPSPLALLPSVDGTDRDYRWMLRCVQRGQRLTRCHPLGRG